MESLADSGKYSQRTAEAFWQMIKIALLLIPVSVIAVGSILLSQSLAAARWVLLIAMVASYFGPSHLGMVGRFDPIGAVAAGCE
jgi:hypothetical protein